MGLRSRRFGHLFGSVVLLGALAACGSSVADADAPGWATPRAAAPSPFCDAARDNATALRPLNGASAGDTVPAAELQRTVDAVRNSGIELLAAAPTEIRSDVQTVVDALDTQLDALVRANGDLAAVARDPAAAASASAGGAVAAAQRVSAYVNRTCRGS